MSFGVRRRRRRAALASGGAGAGLSGEWDFTIPGRTATR